ncbi:MAG: mechanosensitive ion channel family protein [Cyanobium sp.]
MPQALLLGLLLGLGVGMAPLSCSATAADGVAPVPPLILAPPPLLPGPAVAPPDPPTAAGPRTWGASDAGNATTPMPAATTAAIAAATARPEAASTATPTATGAAPSATPASAWVTLDGVRVLEIRVAAGAQKPAEVAERASRLLRQLAEDPTLDPRQLVVVEEPPYWMVAQRRPDGSLTPRLAVDARAARSFQVSQQALAERYRQQLQMAIQRYRSRHSPAAWLRGTMLALLVLVVYLAWVVWQGRLHRQLRQRLRRQCRGLELGPIRLLETHQLRRGLTIALAVAHWSLLLLISYLLIPLLLGFFPPTQVLAAGLRGQIAAVLQAIAAAVLAFIPDLLTISLIVLVTALLLRASNAWFRALDQERVRLPGFYPEWGRPTGRIAAVLIVMAGLAVAYPYIPGTGSRAFQGAGLFVGVLAALGSSAVATNVISGVMLIYTRGFQEGDRVEINGVLGVVQDRALLVTRIRTPRNELVSIPNATVIGASIVNYSLERRETGEPVAVATTVTLGYDVPWRLVQSLLLAAAHSVSDLCDTPEAFVLQTSLNDFHISYELNAYVRDVNRYRESLSELLGAIQDRFAAAGVEILSPAYQANRNGNRSTVPAAPERMGD